MSESSAPKSSQENGSSAFVNFFKSLPILLILIAVVISAALVYFVDFEKIKDVSTLFVTGLVVFAVIIYSLKLVSEFVSKIIYGKKSDWKKDMSLNYSNPDSEESIIAHSLAEKFSLGYMYYKEPESGKERKIFLPVDSSFIVGRDSTVDVYINSEYLSKSHFMIRTTKKEIYVVDLNSTNGTKLNKNRIKAGVKTLIPGDSDIRAGRLNFFVSVL